MARLPSVLEVVLPAVSGLLLVAVLASVVLGRLWYPFDLEWMEGGMLAHAWRLERGLPIYVAPNPDFVPFVYPPGYPVVVAAVGKVVGLTVVVGRGVSLVSIAFAAAAVAFGVRRAGGTAVLSGGAALAFLGTYPQAGAFWDIVRPDALGVALLGWAVVIGLEERRGAPIVAGVLLALSFLVKQNAALLGFPMLLGLALRGWRPALQFALAAAIPAVAAVALLQRGSDGAFLVWMLDVPSSHVMLWERAWIDTPREWGTALPVGFAVVALSLVVDGMTSQTRIPPWWSAGLPVWAGMVAGWWGTYEVPPADAPVVPVAYAFAYFGVVAGLLALVVRVVGGGAGGSRRRNQATKEPIRGLARAPEAGKRTKSEGSPADPPLRGWRQVYALGVLICAGGMSLLMRVHDSGFTNVHTPLLWCLALTFGTTLARWQPSAPVAVAAALAVQLGWSTAQIDRSELVPTEADEVTGWRLVRTLASIDGPVLSPFAAWLPTYAGRPPSLHAMGVWDCNYPGGPYQDDLASIQRALREHRWTIIVGGEYRFLGDLLEHYEPRGELMPTNDPVFRPMTGLPARPWRILVPHEGDE